MTSDPKPRRSALLTARAFYRIGFLDTMAYPLSFALSVGSHLTNVFLYYFVAKLVDTDELLVAGDYFAFTVLGILVFRVLGAGLEEFGGFVQRTIDQGQLELYLVQPVSWSVLPFAWFQWLLMGRLVAGAATIGLGLAMGARFRSGGIIAAAFVLALGVGATHAIGIIAGSVRILAKRADPVLLLYSVATTVFSGLFVPIQLMPRPLQAASWLTPHTYTVDALRQLLLDGGEASARISIRGAVMALIIFNVLAYALGIWLFNRSLNFARRHGLLGAY